MVRALLLHRRGRRFESCSAHSSKWNCPTGLSSSFWLLYASSKEKSWIDWGSKWAGLNKNQVILVRVLFLVITFHFLQKQQLGSSNPHWGTRSREPFYLGCRTVFVIYSVRKSKKVEITGDRCVNEEKEFKSSWVNENTTKKSVLALRLNLIRGY